MSGASGEIAVDCDGMSSAILEKSYKSKNKSFKRHF